MEIENDEHVEGDTQAVIMVVQPTQEQTHKDETIAKNTDKKE